MANPAGESKDEALKLDFDRRVMLQFRGSVVTSDAGLLAYRELDGVWNGHYACTCYHPLLLPNRCSLRHAGSLRVPRS
jgi:hypothetical protein